jgi:Raf kinase inhibitor-like YbhB/YbcL family protein
MRIVRSASVLTLMLCMASAAWAQQAPAAPAGGGQRGGGAPGAAPGAGQRGGGGGPAMALTTTAWPDGAPIPAKYTQAGEQVSPALNWANAPANTVSFVLHMHDPDVAINRTPDTQVHWLMWNIPGTAKGLAEGVPQGAQLPDGSRQISATGPVYRGPGAPATGPVHHYTIEVYALDAMIDVQPSTNAQPATAAVETRASVFKAMSGHILGKAVYVGLFRRPQ